MASAVFLRAVNVGGSKRFKPSELPDDLPTLGLTNIGAAGTYVVAAQMDQGTIREAILDALPFETEVFVREGSWLRGLLEGEPFGAAGQAEGVKRYLTVFDDEPEEIPELPVDWPAQGDWQLRLVRVDPGTGFTLRRPEVEGRLYPNGVLEDLFGVPATTRGWSTVERIGRVLAKQATA